MTETSERSGYYNLAGKRVWVAGHRGMVGAALVRRLAEEGCEVLVAERRDADLSRQSEVEEWMAAHKPQAVFVAAAKVGGILANDTAPVDFLEQNLFIQLNLIRSAFRAGTKKLLFLGSSCVYPRDAGQPIAEDMLLSGPLEPTNQWYAVAKI
ncbi:MAG: NAD-dependent epimerase/dehydratase family protein, partial [Hyphomicrobium sp.]|nr:NAD-dependent epimerase/dehydratase family protein [Hyphomicrobium sp.]